MSRPIEVITPEDSSLLDSEPIENKGWQQVADCLPHDLRELLLGRKIGD